MSEIMTNIRVAVIDCPIDFDIPFFACMECEFNDGVKKDGPHFIVKCKYKAVRE